jgi:hypothetical protein
MDKNRIFKPNSQNKFLHSCQTGVLGIVLIFATYFGFTEGFSFSNTLSIIAVSVAFFISLSTLLFRWRAKLELTETYINVLLGSKIRSYSFSSIKYYRIRYRDLIFNPFGFSTVEFYDNSKNLAFAVPWIWENDFEIEQLLKSKFTIFS